MQTAALVGLGMCIFLSLCVIWQKCCKSPPPWIQQLHALGRPRERKLAGTAVICGGSIAGLVTARICADHFERVVIIDPEIQDSEKPKTRIVQYNALHIFLTLFVDGARRLWPNFDNEIKQAGGRTAAADLQQHYSGIPLLNPYNDYPAGQFPDTLVIRRSVVQTVLQRLVLKDPASANITILPGTVRGVTASDDGSCIQSVAVREVDGTQTSLHDIALIADCTGGMQAGIKWLKAADIPVPDNIRSSYNGNLRYVTITFDVPSDLAADLPIPEAQKHTMLAYVYIPHNANDDKSCLVGLILTDNDKIQFVIGDTAHAQLPQSAPEVVPFISTFREFHAPIPSWVIEVVTVLCERGNCSFDFTKAATQSFIRYDTLTTGALPSNFVAVGDSGLQLNPLHGQGFAKIMLNGMALNSLLHEVNSCSAALPRDFSAHYFKGSASCMQSMWDATRLHDYGATACDPMDGETKDTGRFVRWFEGKLLSAATQDSEVASTLWHVRHMLAADRALFAPSVLWKILWTTSLFDS